MKDIINKNQPCELFNLEKGESFSLSPGGRLYYIVKMYASTGSALCRYFIKESSAPYYCGFSLTKQVYPRNIKRPLYRKRYDLFSSFES